MDLTEVLHSAIEAHQAGNFQMAEDLYREVLRIEPDHFYALHYLGVLHCQRGNFDSAISYIKKALQSNSSDSHAYYNLGIALQSKGLQDEAIDAYEKALHLGPGNADAFVNLGTLYRSKGRYDDAVMCFSKALQINPSLLAAHNNLGLVLKQKGQLDDAITSFRKALELYSDSPDILINLGTSLLEQGNVEEAAGTFEKVLSHRPGSFITQLAHCIAQIPVIHLNETSLHISRKKYLDELVQLRDVFVSNTRKIEDAALAVGTMQPFYLAYQGLNDCELQKIYGDLVCRIMGLRYPQFAERPAMSSLGAGEPLRIGFVSGYFCNHSVWKIPIKGWIENLDKKRFKLYGYYTWNKKDKETATAKHIFKRFVEDIDSFEDLCNIIKKDDLHILIFPEIGMDPLTSRLAALRLAPVQCVSWGHPTTTGLPTIDYFLSSDLMEPTNAEDHYTEKLVRLPNLSVYYEPPDLQISAFNREYFGLQPDTVIYHCCQAIYKYLPQYDEVFPHIAQRVPNCKFLFGSHPNSEWLTELFRKRIRQAFERFGLKAEKFVVFLPFLDVGKYDALYYLSDVFLDPIGWSGCNSALEAVTCNLPVVTLPGELMRSRDSFAILTIIDVSETIASSPDHYVDIAVTLANDKNYRNYIVEKISANKDRIYRDRNCISALGSFCEKVVRGDAIDKKDY
jgi:protein O-GlcNAc transferase